MNKYYITTAIDYTNDIIHVGHIFQKLIADVLARYYRLKLGKDNVLFLTGTDEYGQKVEKAAKEAGVTPKEFADRISRADREQQDSIDVSYDRFIRTTDSDHLKVVQEIWQRVEKQGDIYLGKFSGLYCVGCESYYTEEELVEHYCPYHPNLEIKNVTEEDYFFRWSRYQDFLIDYIEKHPEFIFPEGRRKEMLAFAKSGIQDIPISRTSFKWGISVPGHPDHVIYVWFDALINYLTGVGFLENKKCFNKFWPADIHILGKDNAQKHSLLWPAMLKSAGIKLPKTVLVNGFLSLNGQKISKSLGNIIRPTDWVEKYGVDAIRYYLLRYTTVTEDSDISEDKLKIAYNSDLANGLGNLVARVAKLCETHSVIAIRQLAEKQSLSFNHKMTQQLEEYKLNEALSFIWSQIAEADKKINETKPWELPEEKVKPVLENLVAQIQQIAFNLKPFLPETSEKILKQFSGEIKSSPPLFPRV